MDLFTIAVIFITVIVTGGGIWIITRDPPPRHPMGDGPLTDAEITAIRKLASRLLPKGKVDSTEALPMVADLPLETIVAAAQLATKQAAIKNKLNAPGNRSRGDEG